MWKCIIGGVLNLDNKARIRLLMKNGAKINIIGDSLTAGAGM